MLECRFGQFYAPARPPSSPGVFWTNHQQGRRPPTDLTRPLNPRPAARSYLRRLLHCALPYTCSETKYVGQPTEAQSSAVDGRGIGLDGWGWGWGWAGDRKRASPRKGQQKGEYRVTPPPLNALRSRVSSLWKPREEEEKHTVVPIKNSAGIGGGDCES